MKRLIVVLFLAVMVAGCGASTAHYVKKDASTVNASFDVNLDRQFVQNMSCLGAGQFVMIALVGPFTNNAVLLEAKTFAASGEQIAFRQRLNWGSNRFAVCLKKNNAYKLTVLLQGTRDGCKPIGEIRTGEMPDQSFNVVLHGEQVSVQ